MVQKGLIRLVRQLDEGGLSKLLVEMALFPAVNAHSAEDAEPLMLAAKYHKVDMVKCESQWSRSLLPSVPSWRPRRGRRPSPLHDLPPKQRRFFFGAQLILSAFSCAIPSFAPSFRAPAAQEDGFAHPTAWTINDL
jgi:hypothetical protein